MDERLAELEHRVAAAADAWLADPRDGGVYTRLIRAIEDRRRFLHPQLATDAEAVEDAGMAGARGRTDEREVDQSGAPIGAVDQDEVLDDLGADQRAPATVGESLAGDVTAALHRLGLRPEPRRGSDAAGDVDQR